MHHLGVSSRRRGAKAAYQYMPGLKQPITNSKSHAECRIQWGPNAKLVLRDPDSHREWDVATPKLNVRSGSVLQVPGVINGRCETVRGMERQCARSPSP